MRIWLAGSRTFGAQVLRALLTIPNVTVVGVTTDSDDALAALARAYNIMRLSEIREHWISDLTTDVIVGAQNYTHISQEAREAALYGAIGYHPSLLPRHRGRKSVEHTIGSGDAIAGGTVYQLDNGWDTGPIIKQDWCHVLPHWTASDLWREQLFPMGIRLLTEVISGADYTLVARAGVPWELQSQDERLATLAN